MNYDLIISEIRNSKALTILAQQLATSLSISHQKAFNLLKELPQVLAKNIDEPSMHYYVEQYHQFGVTLHAVRHDSNNTKTGLITLRPVARKSVPDKKIGVNSNVFASHKTTPESPSTPTKTGAGNTQSRVVHINKQFIFYMIFSFLLLAVIIIFVLNPRFFHINFTTTLKLDSESFANSTTKNTRSHNSKRTATHKKRNELSKAHIDSSTALCDSAKSIGYDLNAIINFYKIAISFNRYNFNAWSGLLATYKKAGMSKKYQQCLKEMKEIFGEEALTISGIVQRYGIVKDIYTSDDSVLTISYTTETGSEETRLREMYSIFKALSSQDNGSAVTLTATFEKTCETIIHVRPGMDISTFGNFRKNASIHIFK